MQQTPEQHRNRRLDRALRDSDGDMTIDEVMETTRRYAAAGLDVPGPRAVQLADEVQRQRMKLVAMDDLNESMDELNELIRRDCLHYGPVTRKFDGGRMPLYCNWCGTNVNA